MMKQSGKNVNDKNPEVTLYIFLFCLMEYRIHLSLQKHDILWI